MQRRDLLATVGGVIGAVAGCLSASGTGGDGTSSTTSTASRTTQADSTETTSIPSLKRVGQVELDYYYWDSAAAIRYWDAESESLKLHRPENDRWVVVTGELINVGGESVPAPEPSDFAIRVDGEDYQGHPDVPALDDEQLRPRDRNETTLCCLGINTSRSLPGGESAYWDLIADVAGAGPPRVAWRRSDSDVVLGASEE